MEKRYIHIVVHPKSKREKIQERENGYLEIYCKEPAERGLANACVKKLVAQHFNLSEKTVRIISGQKKPKKLIGIVI